MNVFATNNHGCRNNWPAHNGYGNAGSKPMTKRVKPYDVTHHEPKKQGKKGTDRNMDSEDVFVFFHDEAMSGPFDHQMMDQRGE